MIPTHISDEVVRDALTLVGAFVSMEEGDLTPDDLESLRQNFFDDYDFFQMEILVLFLASIAGDFLQEIHHLKGSDAREALQAISLKWAKQVAARDLDHPQES